MLVSIIMPAYNAANYIQHAIESIYNQTYQNWELLIADDGSTDNTVEIINKIKDPRIKTFHNDSNIGYLKTCNKLFHLCSGEFIAFQDADDWSSNVRLERQLAEFSSDKDLGICGTWAQYIDSSGKVVRDKNTPTAHHEIVDELRFKNSFCGASIMIRKSVYERIGGYKEYFNRIGNEDYDWSMRIVEKYKSKNISEYLYMVGLTTGSVSRTINSAKQLISDDLVHFLARQRVEFGCDSLTGLDVTLLYNYEKALLQPFEKDKSLMFRRAADIAAYNKDLKNLKKYSWLAWKTSPFNSLNSKYFIKSQLNFFC